jgi:hypothetical protein
MKHANFAATVCAAALMAVCFVATGHAQTVLQLDARQQPAIPETGYFKMGTAVSPDGHSIGINNRFLTRDGKPWIPVMGEFHYSRYPAQYWEEEIMKMKSAGVDIIATYVFWVHHEEKADQFNWADDHDLHRFVALCAKHDMKVFLRIGPWDHGEVRYGGTPEWVVEQMPTRRNDPTYMRYVRRFWTQIAEQVKGDFWKDGGPVIGIQLENEYNATGPGQGAEHILALKKMALSLGFDVPLYTVTGWDGTVYPKGEVTPVFGGYLDEPWGLGTTKMAPAEVYNFRFNSRVAGDAGAQTAGATAGTAIEDSAHTPFLGAEYAGGLPNMYRRRPLVAPDDVGAMLPVQLGSGVNLYGYYMFHGGRNPAGQGRLEENALLGGYNDVPIINYDFQAPFGQYGEPHPVLDAIRPYHLFLHAFGERLAPMAVHAPQHQPSSRADVTTPRFSVRSSGDSGFVFMNNYLRQYPMAEQKNVQFGIDLPGGKLTFPSQPVNIPTGAYFIWPFNFDLDGVNLAWATAQPLSRIETGPSAVTYVFAAEDGIPADFAFSPAAGVKSAALTRHGAFDVARLKPSRSAALTFQSGGKTVSIVLLSHADAAHVWSGEVGGKTRLVLSTGTVEFGKDGLKLLSTGDARFKLGLYPALAATPRGNLKVSAAKPDGIFQSFTAQAPEKTIAATLTKTREAGVAPPINIGGAAKRALQPYPETFGRSAAWSISVPANALNGVSDAFLKISYQGDVARLFSGATMLDDEYFYGPAWTIGLKRFAEQIKSPLTLTVLPLRKDAPIYIDDAVRAALPADDQVARVISVKVIPQYRLDLTFP